MRGMPSTTLRDCTEWPQTVTTGTNRSLVINPAISVLALERPFAWKWKKGARPEKWDGQTGERIMAVLERVLGGPLA